MNIKMPKVTVISGYYNRESYVDESIESLINQSYKNLEIILFDDYSTDNTYLNLKHYEESDKRVRVIKNVKNEGFVRTLIEIINKTETDFIAIHGSGDISLPNRIESQMDFIQLHPNIGVVGTKRSIKLEDGTLEEAHVKTGYVTTDDFINANPITHGSVLYRKSSYIKSGGYREVFTFAQDRDLWLRMSLITDMYVLPEIHYIMKKPTGTVSTTLSKYVVQRMLSRFSVQMIEMRMQKGYDYIDIYKVNSLLLFNPKLIKKELVIHLFIQIVTEKQKNIEYLFSVLELIDKSPFFQFFLKSLKEVNANIILRKLLIKLLKIKIKHPVKEYEI